jgi:ATP/maltotriose-dependent transcriptional regulator MalT
MLGRPELVADDHCRALALLYAGAHAADLGDRANSRAIVEEAVEIFRQHGDRFHENYGLNIISWTLFTEDELDRAAVRLTESLVIGREMGHVRWTSAAVGMLANIAILKGERDVARRLAQESMEVALAGKDAWCIQLANGGLGFLALLDGELERAEYFTSEAMRIAEELGDIRNQPAHRLQLAEIANDRGDRQVASDHLLVSLDIGRQTGSKWIAAESLLILGELAIVDGRHAEALSLEKECLALNQQLRGRSSLVACFEAFAQIAEAMGERTRATRFLAAADEVAAQLGYHLPEWFSVNSELLANVPRRGRGTATSQPAPTGQSGSFIDDAVAEALAYELPPSGAARETQKETPENPLGLTDRELEVLRIMADGMSNQQIADSLYITRHTAMNHVNNILGKLDVSSRTAAVAIAIRSGIA